MESYKERLLIEKKELDLKLEKLNGFIADKDKFLGISAENQELLIEQKEIMKKYSLILEKRIGIN